MRRGRGAAFGRIVAGLAVVACVAATPAAAARGSTDEVDCYSRDLGNASLFVRGTVDLDFPPALVFAVVTDYGELPRYVSAMDSSQVVRRDSTSAVVRQVGTAGLLVRRKVRLVLRFKEEPTTRLRFEKVGGDFPVYYGSWEFGQRTGGTRLVYSVTMRAPAYVPQWIVRPFAERVLCRTLSEVRSECARRSGAAQASGSR